MYNQETVNEVASQLEDLTIVMKTMIENLRTGAEYQPYAAVYWLRLQVSREVAKLGSGQPSTRTVEQYYKSLIN